MSKKISQLTLGQAVSDTDLYETSQDIGGVLRSRKVTADMLSIYNGTKYFPAVSTTHAIPRFSNDTGYPLEDSGVFIDDSDNVTGLASLYIGAGSKSASAILQLDSTTQGFLPPRMTSTQRDAIISPVAGLTIYNTTTGQTEEYSGSVWNAAGGDVNGPASSTNGAIAIFNGATGKSLANTAITIDGSGLNRLNAGVIYSNSVSTSNGYYDTGTIEQSGTTITGTGTTFNADMVGGLLTYANNLRQFITGYIDPTHITVDISRTVAPGATYRIDYLGATMFNGTLSVSGFLKNGSASSITFNGAPISDTLLRLNSASYNTGTMSQTGSIITGVGTNWTFDMVGGSITTVPGGVTSMILEVAGTNVLIVDSNINLSSTNYVIHYNGIQSSEQSGALGITQLLANTLISTPHITTNGVNLLISPATNIVDFDNSNLINIYDATFDSLINTPMINTLSGQLDIFSSNGIVNLINAVNPGVSNLISEYVHGGVEVIAQASDYTLAATDWNTHQSCSKSSAQTITIPANATVPAVIGTWVSFSWSGVGQPSFAPAGGVTLNSQLNNRKIAAPYCAAVAIKVGINTWELYGALTA